VKGVVGVAVRGFSSHSCGRCHRHVILSLVFPFTLYDCLRCLFLALLITSCCVVTPISTASTQSQLLELIRVTFSAETRGMEEPMFTANLLHASCVGAYLGLWYQEIKSSVQGLRISYKQSGKIMSGCPTRRRCKPGTKTRIQQQ